MDIIHGTLKLRFLAVGLLLTCSLAVFASGQQPSSPAQTLVIMPFENRSQAPGLEWIAEAFPEVLAQRMAAGDLYVLRRDERLKAYDRAGIPASVRPSRATLYRIAEQMDVDYAVLGSYTFDGRNFRATAQLLNMKQRHLSPEITESGALPQLLTVETALAWDLLRAVHPGYVTSRAEFLAAAPLVRLDAFEDYIRGLIAASTAEKLERLRQAARLDPGYTDAILELGKTYFAAHDYDNAATWLARIPNTDPQAGQANFLLGLSAYYQGNWPRAEAAFLYVLQQFPLTEVYNNLGVVRARLGKPEAIQLFQKAVNADPSDPDYRFNLGVSLYRSGDTAGAARELRECLALRPDDGDANSLLAAITSQSSAVPVIKPADARIAPTTFKLPWERMKRNYDGAAFRQLTMEMQNASEERLAKMDAPAHAAHHLRRGRDLLSKGFPGEAEKELREAVNLDPNNALAHALLADALEDRHSAAASRAESDAALRLSPSAEVYVVLAGIDLRENNREGAVQLLDKALQLDAGNAEALAMKQKLENSTDAFPPGASKQ